MDIHNAQKMLNKIGPDLRSIEVQEGVTLRSYRHPRKTKDRLTGEVINFIRLEVRSGKFLGMVPIRSGTDLVYRLERLDHESAGTCVAKGQVWFSCRQIVGRVPFSHLFVKGFSGGEVVCVRGTAKEVRYLLESFHVDSFSHQYGFSRFDFHGDLRARSARHFQPTQSDIIGGTS